MTLLGKRKRREFLEDTSSSAQLSNPAAAQLQSLLRKHFEATYEPIPTNTIPTSAHSGNVDREDSDEEISENSDSASQASDSDLSDWDGLSISPPPQVQVVEHTTKPKSAQDESDALLSKIARKNFMTSKPSFSSTSVLLPSNPPTTDPLDPTSAASLQANDLALHRLLTESNLLSSSSNHSTFSSSTSLTPTLKARHAATDIRLLSLGAKTPLSKTLNKTMPMAQRKSIEKKKTDREKERREEARREGIVLERVKGGKGVKKGKERDRVREILKEGGNGGLRLKGRRDVGGPSVGRWKGGTLVLGKGDVRRIEGPVRRGGGGGGKRGGRGGRRSGRRSGKDLGGI